MARPSVTGAFGDILEDISRSAIEVWAKLGVLGVSDEGGITWIKINGERAPVVWECSDDEDGEATTDSEVSPEAEVRKAVMDQKFSSSGNMHASIVMDASFDSGGVNTGSSSNAAARHDSVRARGNNIAARVYSPVGRFSTAAASSSLALKASVGNSGGDSLFNL